MSEDEGIELEEPEKEFATEADRRPHMEVPLPVMLVAVADVHALAAAGIERELDGFYVGMLGFERDLRGEGLAYFAENHRLVFRVLELPGERAEMRPIGIEVLSLNEAEQKLIDREIWYEKQKGLAPGTRSVLCRDPAGNWVELTERREI